jgi:hypothetical protein
MLVVQLLDQVLSHLENQDQVVFREPVGAGSLVNMLFCVSLPLGVFLIPTIVPIYSGVLVVGIDGIFTVILHLRRDFFFNYTTCHGWLRKIQRGAGTCGRPLLHGGLCKLGGVSSQLGGISLLPGNLQRNALN